MKPPGRGVKRRKSDKKHFISWDYKSISKKIQNLVDRPAHPPYMPLHQDGVAGFSGT
jgi:hypothetical protein